MILLWLYHGLLSDTINPNHVSLIKLEN